MLRAIGVLALVGGALASEARASTPDVLGLGSAESGVGGASAARVRDASAAFYDPAGLVGVGGPEVTLGLLGCGSLLDAGGRRRDIAEPLGVVIGAAAPVPLEGALAGRLFVGVALYLVPDAIVRVIARPAEEPFFPYYDNRTQRLVVLPSLALALPGGVSVGLAANYLAGLRGRVAAAEGATRAIEARVDEQIGATVALNAGVRWRSPRERVAAALVYRQQFSVPFSTVTTNRVAGEPLDVSVSAEGLFTPHELVAGVALAARPWLLLSADVTWSMWSAWRGPYVEVGSTLPLVGSLSAAPPRLRYDDAVALRLGAEAVRAVGSRLELRARAGIGGETSPVPAEQPGVTNQLDGEKLLLAAGVGVALRLKRATVRLDAHATLHLVRSRTLVKRIAPAGTRPDPASALRDELPDDPSRPETLGVQVSNPGWPRITGGGAVYAGGFTLTVAR